MGRALVCGTARPAWAVWPSGAGMRSGSQTGPAAAVGARGRGFRARLRLWHSEPPQGWVAVTLPTCAGLLGDSGMWQGMEHRAEDEASGDEATFDHLRNPRLLGKPRIRKASRPAGKISPRAPPVQLSARPRGPGSRGVSYRHPDVEGSRLGLGSSQMETPRWFCQRPGFACSPRAGWLSFRKRCLRPHL